MDGWKDEMKDEWMDGWEDEFMDEWMDGYNNLLSISLVKLLTLSHQQND